MSLGNGKRTVDCSKTQDNTELKLLVSGGQVEGSGLVHILRAQDIDEAKA